MQSIRKFTLGGCELSTYHGWKTEDWLGFALLELELEELGFGVLDVGEKAAPSFERLVHRLGDEPASGMDLYNDGRPVIPG